MLQFYDIKKENGYMSNFSPHGIMMDNLFYPTVEHYFQAKKFDSFPDYANEIRKTSTPNMARVLGLQKVGGGYPWRTNLNPLIKDSLENKVTCRPDWDTVRCEVMFTALTAKFTQHAKLNRKLAATGELQIQENSPRDSFWGIGKDGKGENHLGKLLMRVRAELPPVLEEEKPFKKARKN